LRAGALTLPPVRCRWSAGDCRALQPAAGTRNSFRQWRTRARLALRFRFVMLVVKYFHCFVFGSRVWTQWYLPWPMLWHLARRPGLYGHSGSESRLTCRAEYGRGGSMVRISRLPVDLGVFATSSRTQSVSPFLRTRRRSDRSLTCGRHHRVGRQHENTVSKMSLLPVVRNSEGIALLSIRGV
jgi:hypothetical protein